MKPPHFPCGEAAIRPSSYWSGNSDQQGRVQEKKKAQLPTVLAKGHLASALVKFTVRWSQRVSDEFSWKEDEVWDVCWALHTGQVSIHSIIHYFIHSLFCTLSLSFPFSVPFLKTSK